MFVVQLHYNCIICSREWYIHVFINDASSLSNCWVAAMLYFADSLLTEVFTDYVKSIQADILTCYASDIYQGR